uniref:Sec1 family domain-containing protein MIP3 n=1 Tax=Rhizophora mucronata TaxID=61149 RepID=A0A2P2M844_RHIMU
MYRCASLRRCDVITTIFFAASEAEFQLTAESRGDIFSRLQTACTPRSNNRGNAPTNWKLSVQPESR